MLVLISPAKKLASKKPPYLGKTSLPRFCAKTEQLVELMKEKSPEQIAALMDLSPQLASLNFDRYQRFNLNPDFDSATPALFLFQGDVYQGLQAAKWSDKEVAYAQDHLAILSGLYGILKPLDCIQPYRLEMGTKLVNGEGENLYQFWRHVVTERINEQLMVDASPWLINLASNEYFKVINEKELKFPLVNIHFYEQKQQQIKMIGIYAKKARGMMAKYIIQQQINTIEKLQDFNEGGYQFNPQTSSESQLNFIRVH